MHSVYQHLPQGYIQLLTLHPDDASAKLLCTLQSTSLESAPEYEAVSYAWGSEGLTDTLTISSSPDPKTYQAVVSITPNVTSLLQSLRRADGPRVLWIDAICINQADISERNVQVQQMRSIYTRAIRTVIWLGTATEDGSSDLALAFLNKMAAYQRYLHWTRSEVSSDEEGDEDYAFESDANSFDNHSAQGASIVGDGAELAANSSQASLFDQDTDADAGRAEQTGIYMSRFILRRDWVREWVVEIRWKVMSRYGSYFTLRYWNLVERRRRNQRRERGKAASRDNNRRVSHVAFGIPFLYENVVRGGLGRHGGRDGKLSDLLWNTWDRDTQDPRDMVFAVLGLVSRNEGLLKPDYGKSTRRVFCEAARDIIRTEESLDILLAAGGPRAPCDGGRLPSWVPDWRREANEARPVLFVNRARLLTLYMSNSMNRLVVNGHGYSACGDEKAVGWFGNDLATLHVHAVLIDEVGPVGAPQGPGPVEAGAVVDEACSVAGAALAGKDASWWRKGEQKDTLTGVVVERALCAGGPGEKTKREVIENIAPLRRFFVTKSERRACIGPSSTRPGDKVFVIAGCNFPIVLREVTPGPNGERGMFELLGEAYG
ncbi:hypothetical protein LZ32DRAFT_631198 [Colletotrichum eremochloae]|nr:hypothetical protein LZ32DRAFT_631198 [Colletotrichum eremochloae]